MTRAPAINIDPDEPYQGLSHCPFIISLVRCDKSCNILMIPLKENVILDVFNTVTWKNESKSLIQHISCHCRCQSHGRKCNLNQKWNNKCQFKCKKR